MTTMATLLAEARLAISDYGTVPADAWSDDTIYQWICHAIQDYSIHFPRIATDTLDCSTGDHSYELADDCISVISVEYPSGEDPPQYLSRLSRKHPNFWLYDTYYDLENKYQNTAYLNYIYISAEATTGEHIIVTYNSYHTPVVYTASNVVTSVPPYHEHILLHYVAWQAALERLSDEIQSPDTTIRLIQQYKLALQATEQMYRNSLRTAVQAVSDGGWTGPWRADGYDRIY
jgi:hypothetical protein